MKLDIDRLRRNDPAALKALHQHCAHCARIGAGRVGAGEFADDIAQELCLLVIGDFLDSEQAHRDVDGFLVEAAKRKAHAMRRKANWMREYQTDRLEAAPASDEEAPDRQLEVMERRQRAFAARHALISPPVPPASPLTPHAAQPPPPPPSPPVMRPPRVHVLRNRPEVRSIEAYRQRLGLTHVQLAKLLKVTPTHLRGVLYGRVVGNPGAMLDQIVAFDQAQERSIGGIEISTVTIQQQMSRWRDRLGIGDHPGWHLTLAEALGVHRTTVYRWVRGLSQPRPHVMRVLDVWVDVLANRQCPPAGSALC